MKLEADTIGAQGKNIHVEEKSPNRLRGWFSLKSPRHPESVDFYLLHSTTEMSFCFQREIIMYHA